MHRFEKKTVRHRRYTDQGRLRFKQMIVNETWDDLRKGTASEAADALIKLLVRYLDDCFPWKQFTVKSTDPPWMTPQVKRCAKRKRRTFELYGRGSEYRQLEKEMSKLTARARSDFLEGVKEDILQKRKTSKGYHRAVKRFTTKEATTP